MRYLATMIFVVIVILTVADESSAREHISLHEARVATMIATEDLAGLLDGRAKVQDCRRLRRDRVDCRVTIIGSEQRCELRSAVVQRHGDFYVRGRELKCAPRA